MSETSLDLRNVDTDMLVAILRTCELGFERPFPTALPVPRETREIRRFGEVLAGELWGRGAMSSPSSHLATRPVATVRVLVGDQPGAQTGIVFAMRRLPEGFRYDVALDDGRTITHVAPSGLNLIADG